MTRFDVAEARIREKERTLARIQYETIPLELECNLMRETLDHALTTAVAMARVAREALALPIDEHLEGMGRDLTR